jgi:superfamily II DNA or RNA helicase
MIKLEPYQENAARWLHKKRRGAVIAPAGSGKTIMAAAALDMALCAVPRIFKVRVGWMCNTREQLQQARAALMRFESVGRYAEVDVQCAAAQMDWSDKDVIIIDECHHSVAPIWLKQIQSCRGAVWGFTATPWSGDPERDERFRELFADKLLCVDRSNVKNRLVAARVIMLSDSDYCGGAIDAEISKMMKIRARQFRFMSEQELYKMVSWNVCSDLGIVRNVRRNDAIIRVANDHPEPTLILVNQIEHAQALACRIPGSVACFSKMGIKKRREALAGFRDGSIRCIIATSLADEGLDLPMAQVLVLGSGGRSQTKAEQRTGRVLRTFEGKSEGLIYDFCDRQHPTMERQSKARQSLYRKLGYEIEFRYSLIVS